MKSTSKYSDLPKRITPGINVADILERLRFEINRGQKNAIIDDAIEQVRKDGEVFSVLLMVMRIFATSELNDSNCASVELAGKRVRNMAREALKKAGVE